MNERSIPIFRKKIKQNRIDLYGDILKIISKDAELEVNGCRLLSIYNRIKKFIFGDVDAPFFLGLIALLPALLFLPYSHNFFLYILIGFGGIAIFISGLKRIYKVVKNILNPSDLFLDNLMNEDVIRRAIKLREAIKHYDFKNNEDVFLKQLYCCAEIQKKKLDSRDAIMTAFFATFFAIAFNEHILPLIKNVYVSKIFFLGSILAVIFTAINTLIAAYHHNGSNEICSAFKFASDYSDAQLTDFLSLIKRVDEATNPPKPTE